MQLLEDIYLVGSGRTGIGVSDDNDCHCYLVDGGGEAALIDAGAGQGMELLFSNIADRVDLSQVRTLLLTHSHMDHSGGAADLRARLACRVLVSAAEAHRVETADSAGSFCPPGYVLSQCPVDGVLKDGDTVRVGRYTLQVIATPGHTPGSLCFLLEHAVGPVLFSGDIVQFCPVGGQTGWISAANIPQSDLAAYGQSVRKLAGRDIVALLPGHRLFTLRHGQRVIDAVIQGFATGAIPRSVLGAI